MSLLKVFCVPMISGLSNRIGAGSRWSNPRSGGFAHHSYPPARPWILIHFHQSHYRTFKAYYTEYVQPRLSAEFWSATTASLS